MTLTIGNFEISRVHGVRKYAAKGDVLAGFDGPSFFSWRADDYMASGGQPSFAPAAVFFSAGSDVLRSDGLHGRERSGLGASRYKCGNARLSPARKCGNRLASPLQPWKPRPVRTRTLNPSPTLGLLV